MAKPILAKAWSFDAYTNEKIIVMSDITTIVKVNWSLVLLQILKAKISLERQSQGFSIPLSWLFKDFSLPPSDPDTLHKIKILNAQNVTEMRHKVQEINISLAGILKVNKEIGEELVVEKKPKSCKTRDPKPKRKLVLQSSDS